MYYQYLSLGMLNMLVQYQLLINNRYCIDFLELLYSRIEFCLYHWNIIFQFNTVKLPSHNLDCIKHYINKGDWLILQIYFNVSAMDYTEYCAWSFLSITISVID